MKKIIEFLVGIFFAIIYPNRILNLFRVRNLDQNSNKILGNDNVVKILALLAAIVAVVLARYTPPVTATYTHTVYAVPLEPVLDDRYTHFGSPIEQHIDVILIGDQVQIDLLLATGNPIRAYLDLDGLAPNEQHNHVPIRVEGVEGQITPMATPNAVSGIYIAENVYYEFQLELRTNNSDIFDELNEPSSRYRYRKTLETEYVTIRGPEVLLEDIEEVRAMFNAIDVDNTVGVTTYDVVVVANNISGMPIGDIEIIPNTVEVTVLIYEDLRTINIEVDENLLNFPREYELIDITLDIDEIQVWGDFSDMESTIELPRINFRDLDEEGQITLPIELPNDVDTETDEVVVTVEFEELPPESDAEDED